MSIFLKKFPLFLIYSTTFSISFGQSETAPSAVSAASGGSASLFLTDATSLFWNPAASAVRRFSQMAVAFHDPYALNYWGTATFIPSAGTFGFYYFGCETPSRPQKQLGLSFARSLKKGISLGGGLSAVRQWQTARTGFAVGLLFRSARTIPSDERESVPIRRLLRMSRFSAAVSFRQLFGIQDAYELGAGAAYRLPYERITLYFSRSWTAKKGGSHVGLSWQAFRFLTLYTGVADVNQSRLNFGFGWHREPLSLEAAFDAHNERLVVSASLRTGEHPIAAAEKHYQRAKEALRQRRRGEALKQVRTALQYDEHHLRAQSLLDRILPLVQEEERLIDSLAVLGRQQLAEKNYLEAALLYSQAAKINPAHRSLGKQISILAALANSDLEDWHQKAAELYEASDYRGARRLFEAVLLLNPTHRQAAEHLQKLKEKDADEAERHYSAGLEYLGRKEIYAAEEEFLTTLKLVPSHQGALERLSDLRLLKQQNRQTIAVLLAEAAEKERRGELQNALFDYQRVFTLEKDHPIAIEKAAEIQHLVEKQIDDRLKDGIAAAQRGESLQAKAAFESILLLDPNHAKAKEYLSRLNVPLPAGDRGQSLLRQAQAALASGKYDIAALLADSLMKANLRFKDASALLERLRSQVDVEQMLRKAERQVEQGDLTGAMQTSKALLIVKPNLSAAEEMIRTCRTALRRNVDDFFNRGLKYYTEGNYREAIKWWDEVLRINPQHKGAREYRDRALERIEALENIR